MESTTPNRRSFIKQTGITLSATAFLGLSPLACQSQEELTIQGAIDIIMAQVPVEKNPDTVDTIKSSTGDQKLTGIVTTFLATIEVIRAAIDKNANLIITHEPTYYNHRDEVEWLKEDPVYEYKRNLLEENNIVVWRFHDYWHKVRPDGILQGFINAMGWQGFLNTKIENACFIPKTTMKELASFLKRQLKLDRCFYIGDPELACSSIGMLPGSWGREKHIDLLRKDIDVLIIGEAAEWETVEYVRDASMAGMKKGLIILGHANSEEPGMFYLVEWLGRFLPQVPIFHVPARDPFVPV
ncbi:MAG: Nif3-like dinuclear metal center hexameric protein [Bacteroidota bacterium]